MIANQATLFPSRSVEQFIEDLQVLTLEIQNLYQCDQVPWVIGYSGGKDSTAILQLIWNAIAQLSPEKRTKKISVITTDTLVENPIVAKWVQNSIKQINKAAIDQNMPFESYLLHPKASETFWVGLVGKGYPPPRSKFRWCTERLKISPSNNFIRNVIRQHKETILVLGIRKAESKKRAQRMEKWETKRVREHLSPNMNLPNSLVYSPIEDWSTDEVWMYLMQWENPWGYSNKDLFTLYRGATADNECPLVVDTSTPSCGDSRFGCWVCTLVSQDKSLTAMIQNDTEKEWLQPLLELRAELDVQDNRHKRDFRRRTGVVQLYERNLNGQISIEPIPGPFLKEAREDWLRKILIAQNELRKNAPEEFKDITLITEEELSEIRRIWVEERHEFDDSLPKIYKEVMGETFKDPRPGADDQKLLGSDEWDILAEICQEDTMQLELMSKLLDTERKYFTQVRRVGLYKDLEHCFETSSLSKEEAIAQAHLKRNVKMAASQGDVAAIKKYLAGEPVEPTPEETKQDEKLPLLALEEKQSQENNNEGKSWAKMKFKKGKSSGKKKNK